MVEEDALLAFQNECGDFLEAKYMVEDASSKKFLVSNFTNYKMTDSRPVMEQYNKLLGILGRFTQHKMNIDKAIQVSCIIDKLPPSWKDFKNTLKHLKEELTLVELGNYLHIEESLRVQDNDKPKGNNVAGPSICNVVEHNNSSRYNDNKGKRKHHDITKADPNKKPKVTCWKCGKPGHLKKECKGGNVGNKANGSGIKGLVDGSSNLLKAWWVDSVVTDHVCKNRCWFKTYESLNDGSILYMGNESTAMVHGRGCVDLRLNIVNDNIGSAFMSNSKLNNSMLWHARLGHVHFKRMQYMSKDGLTLTFDMDTEKTRDEVFDQHSYCCNVEDDPKTFDEAIKSQDVAFWKEAINDEMDFIMGNNTWVLADLPPSCKPLGCKWIFKRKLKVDETIENTIRLLIAMASIHNLIIHLMDVKTTFLNGELDEEAPKQWHQKFDEVVLSNGYLLNQTKKCVYRKFDESGKGVIICLYVDDMLIFGFDEVQVDMTKEFLSLRFSMKDMGETDAILGIRTKHKAMTCIRYGIAFVVGKLSRYTSNPVLKGYTDARWISNTEDNSSTSGWVFLLGGGVISWASKKQTCNTSSTMEYEFVAIAVVGKEAEWLENLLPEILLWVKPIAPMSIRCDSAATLAKAYSQMYNGKPRIFCPQRQQTGYRLMWSSTCGVYFYNNVEASSSSSRVPRISQGSTRQIDSSSPPPEYKYIGSVQRYR
nr:hypothetical protein [Tanacetum cinerariifolium]